MHADARAPRRGRRFAAVGALAVLALTPVAAQAAPRIGLSSSQLVFNDDIAGSGPSIVHAVAVTNTGTGTLSVTKLQLAGSAAPKWSLVSPPSLPASLGAGDSIQVQLTFKATAVGPPIQANLKISSSDSSKPTAKVTLRGLGTKGLGGGKEPSLQYVLDTWQIPVNVGDAKPQNAPLGTPTSASDEIPAQRFVKAGPGNVTIESLASFGPPDSVDFVHYFGWYPAGDTSTLHRLWGVKAQYAQTLDPPLQLFDGHSFDPGAAQFGLWSQFPFFHDRQIFQQDTLNTWDPAENHKVRVYPDGPHTYVVAFEEFTSAYDYQDAVVLVHNVTPA